MRYIRLGNSDLKASVIGQGTGQFGTRGWGYGFKYNDDIISNIIDADIRSGITVFDTSETYGNTYSETLLGKNLKKYKRDDFIIITKVAPWNLSYSNIVKATNRSLERLNLKEIDLYMVHYPNLFLPMKETFRALEDLVKMGKIRYIGVSNFNLSLLKHAQELMRYHEIIADEVEYNIFSRRAEQSLLQHCKSENIGIIAFSPLAGGLLTDQFTPNNLPHDRARAFNFFNRKAYIQKNLPLFHLLRHIANEKKATVAQIALSFLINNPTIIAIPAALNPIEVHQNASAASITLSNNEMRKIRETSIPINKTQFFFDHFIVRPISWTKESLKHLY